MSVYKIAFQAIAHLKSMMGLLAIFVIVAPGVRDARAEPRPSQWMHPTHFRKPHAAVPPGPPVGSAEVRQVMSATEARSRAARDRGRVAVLVESGIYDPISTSVSTYVDDLAAVGFSSTVLTVSGSAAYLRNTLITMYAEPESLVGAVLIGELPFVVFEMIGFGYEDFPCDLYFMDLDGVWEDVLDNPPVAPGNGMLDTWTGNIDLEIWVSRMMTAGLSSLGSETVLLDDYFARNHALRWDVLDNSHTGLAYVDDDWAGGEDEDAVCLELLFGTGNVVSIADPEATTAADYITQRLTAGYQLDLIRSHGSPGGHGFYENDHQDFYYVLVDEYTFADPAAAFFSFFVCSGCDYTWPDYLGGTAVFNPEGNGLLAWGSTKTGGMLEDHLMYERVAAGECFGEGFRRWFNTLNDLPFAPDWWYGMVLVGDGSITEHPVDCNDNLIPDDAEIPVSCGGSCTEGCDPDCNCNGIPDSCEGPDCNANLVPDECEIPLMCGGLCTADCDPDCNCNGIPDGCEADCNENDVPDDCDTVLGTSADCNVNIIPDECEITGGGGVLIDEDFAGVLPPPGWTVAGAFQITDQCGAAHASCGEAYWLYAGDLLSCTYGDNQWGELITPSVTLGYGLSELRFCSRLRTEADWDFGRVLVGDTVVWEESGGTGDWEERVVDLRDFAGHTGAITFQFTSDEAVSGYLGWQVDDVYLFSQNMDCNGNEIPDDCDIFDCPPEDVSCQDCNHNAVPDECDITSGTSSDVTGNGVPDECEASSPIPAPYPHNRLRNRYLSFDPNKDANDGVNVAFKITLKSLTLGSCSGNRAPCRTDDDCRQCSATGTPCIGAVIDCEPDPPGQTCDLTGETCVNDQAGSVGRTWWVGPEHPTAANDVHLMVTQPYRKVSDDWPDVVHVADCEVVPLAVYGVRTYAVDAGIESAELELRTINKPDAWWADCVGPLGDYCTGNWASCAGDGDCPPGETCTEQWPPPDGFTGFMDVNAAVFTFSGLPAVTATGIWNLDLHGDDGGQAHADPPNYVVNFADIANMIGAFQGRPYPYDDPGDCPDVGAWP